MTEREKNLETILKQLLTQHFWSTDLCCSLYAGESIKSTNIELYIQIAQEIPEVIMFHK